MTDFNDVQRVDQLIDERVAAGESTVRGLTLRDSCPNATLFWELLYPNTHTEAHAKLADSIDWPRGTLVGLRYIIEAFDLSSSHMMRESEGSVVGFDFTYENSRKTALYLAGFASIECLQAIRRSIKSFGTRPMIFIVNLLYIR